MISKISTKFKIPVEVFVLVLRYISTTMRHEHFMRNNNAIAVNFLFPLCDKILSASPDGFI